MEINYKKRIYVAVGILCVCVVWNIVFKRFRENEWYAVYSPDNNFTQQIQSVLPDDTIIQEIVGIKNASVVVKAYNVKTHAYSFVNVFFDPDTMRIRDHAETTRYMESVAYMPVAQYNKLTQNIKKHFSKIDEYTLVGITRLLVDGQAGVIVFDNRRKVNKVYDVSFNKISMEVESDVFLNIEFANNITGTGTTITAPTKAYSLDDYFQLIRNTECHFDKQKTVYGTIRLTDTVLTVIVRDIDTNVSRVYDVHYDKVTMNINRVSDSDMAYYVNNNQQHDMHMLIKKSPLFNK